MERHLLDRPEPDDRAARLAAFLRIERENRPHPVTRGLQQQPRGERPARADQAMRIARGHRA